ncbi:MAG TPA: sulfurtransferase [Streptosporangiaceae bacterium]|jgi:thiosulfate/3-mercaptopyruvate sulfurtransferase
MSSASGPLTEPATLATQLAGADPPVLIDVRWRLGGPPGRDSYLTGHLPGAVFADLDADLSAPPGDGGRHPLPAPARFQDVMRAAGVRAGHPVVAYDDGDSTIAARLWWSLRYFGHDEVLVLDGGYRAWTEAGLPVTSEIPAPAPGDFAAEAGHMPVLDAAAAAALAQAGVLLDARAAERYLGGTDPVDRVAGHIPGALSAPTRDNVDAGGRFRPAGQLRERFAALGVRGEAAGWADPGDLTGPGHPGAAGQPGDAGQAGDARHAGDAGHAGGQGQAVAVGAYCGSGVTAAHEVLALGLAGIRAALYPGSWSGWITDPSRPVATGPEPG